MNFSLSEEQEALRDLASQIFSAASQEGRLEELGDKWLDLATWAQLGKSGLLGVAIGEEIGGGGLGFVELCLVLEEQGRALARVPLVPAIAPAALAVDRFGTADQRASLGPVIEGQTILSAALAEPLMASPLSPSTRARREGSGWVLEGQKHAVPHADVAQAILVPARLDGDQIAVFLIDPGSEGIVLERQETTHGEPQFRMTLSGVRTADDAILGDVATRATVLQWLWDRAVVALCALQLGIAEEALRRTAAYTSERKQFNRPIATFQTVAARAADAYIDTEAIRLTMLQASWRLNQGLPASREVDVAKFWAAEGCQRVVAAAQHLHGGIGVDLDYPLHRYTLWSKYAELSLGSATWHLCSLGELLADGPFVEAEEVSR